MNFFSHSKYLNQLSNNLEEKTFFSGVLNSSSKLSLISFFLEKSKVFAGTKNILFILKDSTELMEFAGIIDVFIDKKKYNIFSLNKKDIYNELKIEWVIEVTKKNDKSSKKNIFLMSEAEIESEKFPNINDLIKEQITIKKGDKITPVDLFNKLIKMNFDLSQDSNLKKGQYRRSGDIIDIFPVGTKNPIKIEIAFDSVSNIWSYSSKDKKVINSFSKINIFPTSIINEKYKFSNIIGKNDLIITNDSEDIENFPAENKMLNFVPFPESESKNSYHMNFLSVLKFYILYDLLTDIRNKIENGYKIIFYTHRGDEIKNIFTKHGIPFTEINSSEEIKDSKLYLINTQIREHVPQSFQNPKEKVLFLTDREIFQLRQRRKQKSFEKLNLEFLTSLKMGDFVVHMDHGIGHFFGVVEQEILGNTKEYLEIDYAGGDKLFVPVDQADKVSRYICDEDTEPKLNRLGSNEWENIQKKVKKETEKIAKDLLKLYAEREQTKKDNFSTDTERQKQFESSFPYVETPGQLSAIADVKKDMESDKPMDRLVCGDVGFGKTEIAIRAAFKAVDNNKQVVLISPVTILAQQHYDSFKKRMQEFNINIEMISRFRTPAEQKKILENLEKGKVDIIIGTHRLLQKDVKFKNLGLLIIDEEQRFGVKQKETLKSFRKNVDILTMSATPIPRTLNLALNKLRDISTITTPPVGRLPIATEVRKYSDKIIKDAIEAELNRNGQVYVLYNKVKTIEGIAEKISYLVPNAKVVIGHGQLQPNELEKRILAFKKGEFNVLVASTIIENGIDLPNANTMIVMNSEKFGVSQLYQLRGRIGRSNIQAFAYFLYSNQKLSIEAKKRLKSIVEASDLGSGFQIAMRDLEIRGSGDILGVNQSGTVNSVGVGHFLRLLNETMKKMKENKTSKTASLEVKDISVEIPINAYIPSEYIADTKEKVLAYQNLATIKTRTELKENIDDLKEEYGVLPKEVKNLFEIILIKILAKESNITNIKCTHDKELQLFMNKNVSAKEIMNLLSQQSKWFISENKLTIPLKELGENFIKSIKESLKLLKKK